MVGWEKNDTKKNERRKKKTKCGHNKRYPEVPGYLIISITIGAK